MHNNEIIDAVNDGIKVGILAHEQIEEKFLDIISALDFMGLDFSFFRDDQMLAKTVAVIKGKFKYLTDRELTVIINMGCQGEFKKQGLNIKGYHLFSWIHEYLDKRRQVLADWKRNNEEDVKCHARHNVSKSPLGAAIAWKIGAVPAKQWDDIPLQEIADTIQRKGNLHELRNKYIPEDA